MLFTVKAWRNGTMEAVVTCETLEEAKTEKQRLRLTHPTAMFSIYDENGRGYPTPEQWNG